MTLESVEKLREQLRDTFNKESVSMLEDGHALMLAADEIEREVSERYMELPVDADGVPIHLGDELDNINKSERYKVTSIGDNGYIRIYSDTGWIHSSKCRHVKPDPVKELLCEFASDVSCMGDGVKRSFSPDEKCIVELADAIREAVGE